ncbi:MULTISPECIES: type II toxin-antitoxin system VapC family toxin [unclassified Ectothiorhodospira]|uniref:type II toxin-antitoxin system VapC family toxin n=1 Tax=unclassified Ectothiorhodospira TaxID=2684909 RepID=UPI001EE95CD2|nr:MULTISPECIES: type II toxin-antitoxin system VapC family toxin [unclassified Ectothiorhodospira]MCG5516404.1 type II toxin-antitoxin system VapC family toxin [Ectothiorhodospira sp. 9100]MCG5519346.1 type II toxin-antitoxin system VapC family toxin [Ectothiorhodospira sp. 9905]
MDDNALFIDTNVLVYANIAEAPIHSQALAKLGNAHHQGRPLWISRQVLREFAAVRSRSQPFAQAATPEIIVQRLRYFMDHFEVADDTSLVSEHLLTLMAELPIGGKQIHDANIVATMMAAGIPALLTHNVKDFKRFEKYIRIETLV